MRRIALMRSLGLAVLACALLPAGALADHHGHHRHHHARRARRFFDHPRLGNAGTVVSFTAGVLTIKLGDGTSTEPATTISGKVDERRTEIRCFAPLPETPAVPVSTSARAADHGPGGGGNGGDRNGRGGEHGEGGGQESGGQPVSQPGGSVPVSGTPAQPQPQTQQQPQGQGDRDDNDEGEDRDATEEGLPGQQQCGTANLTPGAVVHEAQLRLDASGAVFEEIVLVV